MFYRRTMCAAHTLLLAAALTATACARAGADRYHPERGAGAGHTRADPAPVDPAERTAEYWYNEAWATIEARAGAGAGADAGTARNVVMFLGDGMSVPTLAAARTLLGQRSARPGEEEQLSFERFPTVGLAKTYCVSSQVPDSACTATAYLCGVKANQGTLGVTAAVPRWDCPAAAAPGAAVQSIAEWALAAGRDAGVVTTTRVTHASPGGVFAKAANRHWENDAEVAAAGYSAAACPDIAHQLVHQHPGNRLKVILGGGRQQFIPTYSVDEEGGAGLRTDDRNLIEEWQREKESRNVTHRYIWNRDQLMNLMDSPPEYLMGLFENNHLQYNLERNETTEPTLSELTEVAIRSLSRNEKGFFLFVEGGRIDHAHHDNYAELALDETIEMARAVQRATELLSASDSLLVVTADHAHVMAFNGYTRRGGDILGPSDDRGADGVPYMTLSYTNGPGARTHVGAIRPDVTQDQDYGTLRWRSHADVPLESETHGGDDVAVFAWGAQHAMFSGLYEQSQLPHRMAYAACLGAGPQAAACAAAHSHAHSLAAAHSLTMLLILLLSALLRFQF